MTSIPIDLVATAVAKEETGFLDWLNSNSAAVSAVATVVAAMIAALALVSAAHDSQGRSRPMVTAEFRFGPHSATSILLSIRNYGPSVARKITVIFDPPLPEEESTQLIRDRYALEIPTLSPSQELVNTWFIPKYFGNRLVGNVFAYPDDTKVTVRYRGGWHRYKDVYALDVNVHKFESEAVSSESHLGAIRGIRDALNKIESKRS